ncbi:glycine--tRNA ligase [Halolamina salifodinae]|uniref:glycine--tRNA ligase n=1 Tax=Halolamina salifodinae TaxID=1202767 RepID=A0A8T4GZB4_9EURY|nr:glycine--tRNA ligase [Halolamina salifodinae]MBP1988367.1 glycyl-tRNA synthetase [Halolamina salifodinae]
MGERADVVELAKRRGFFFAAAEAYGGAAGFYTFGPEGAALKRNVESAWRDRFALKEDNEEIAAPTIMPEPVFEASGHLDTFDDMLVECAECGESHRADHLVEGATALEDAEALEPAEIATILEEHEIDCPDCGAALAGQEVEEFNLMFQTSIGPGSGQPGYLRPETAQGIFVEFPRLKEYARGKLPFGVTQIGPAYRNEISPRRGLIRVRELTQAELEQFIDPEDDEPPLETVADVALRLYAVPDQEESAPAAEGYREVTVREAVDEEVVASDWIAYYLGVAQEWYERIGLDTEKLRFRQHLPGERAHYASDCWDAEAKVESAGGDWIEIAGISSRGDYDLSKHADGSGENFTVFKQYDEPQSVLEPTVDPDMSVLGPEFGGDAGAVAEALEDLAAHDPDAFEQEVVTVTVDGERYDVDTDIANFEVVEKTEAGVHITPHVIEPSFGVDRTVYALIDHGLERDELGGETRDYLSLAAEMAPTDVAVFPLVSNHEPLLESAAEVVSTLRAAGFDATRDDSGSIGRRYRRQDEVGTPFCVTVDRDGLEDDPETITLRDRDTGAQARIPTGELVGQLEALRDGEADFEALLSRYETVETADE